MAVFVIFGALASLVRGFSMDQALQTISQIQDTESWDLTDGNVEVMLKESPWFVYVYHPKDPKCIFYGPQWKFFAEKVAKAGIGLKVGKVNVEGNSRLVRGLGISSIPSFLYIKDLYVYNYTGKTQTNELFDVYWNNTYQQYDRQPLKLGLGYHWQLYYSLHRYMNIAIQKYPFLLLSFLLILAWLMRKQRKLKTD